MALAGDGLSLDDLRRRRTHRKGHSLIPFAMLEHCKQGYRNIAIDAALGKSEAYGPFLRMMADAHTILQPEKDEMGQDRVPMPATFVRACTHEQPPNPAGAEAETPGASSPLDGYVAVDPP